MARRQAQVAGAAGTRPTFERIGAEIRDVRVSRPIKTTGGDSIRAVLTGRKTAVLTPIGSVLDDITVIVCWPDDEEDDDVVYLSFGGIWDAVKEIAGAVLDVITDGGSGGGGGGCTPQTNVTVNVSGGSVRDIKVETNNCTNPS